MGPGARHSTPGLPVLSHATQVPPGLPSPGPEDGGHQWSQTANHRVGHAQVGRRVGAAHTPERASGQNLALGTLQPALTYQGEDYEEDGVGPVLGVRRNHHCREGGAERLEHSQPQRLVRSPSRPGYLPSAQAALLRGAGWPGPHSTRTPALAPPLTGSSPSKDASPHTELKCAPCDHSPHSELSSPVGDSPGPSGHVGTVLRAPLHSWVWRSRAVPPEDLYGH